MDHWVSFGEAYGVGFCNISRLYLITTEKVERKEDIPEGLPEDESWFEVRGYVDSTAIINKQPIRLFAGLYKDCLNFADKLKRELKAKEEDEIGEQQES